MKDENNKVLNPELKILLLKLSKPPDCMCVAGFLMLDMLVSVFSLTTSPSGNVGAV